MLTSPVMTCRLLTTKELRKSSREAQPDTLLRLLHDTDEENGWPGLSKVAGEAREMQSSGSDAAARSSAGILHLESDAVEWRTGLRMQVALIPT